MMTTLIEFLGYTFCFWLCWKVFDGVVKIVKGEELVKVNPYCHDCEKLLEANQRIMEENNDIKEQLKIQKKTDNVFEKDSKSSIYPSSLVKDPFGISVRTQRAIKVINRSGKYTLMKVKGIGVVHAKRIIDAKPISSKSDLYKVLPAPLVNKLIDEFGRGK